MIIRKLKNYAWKYSDRKISILREGYSAESNLSLSKVEFMSLARFIIRVLDKMRIDGNYTSKKKINSLSEDIKRLKSELSIQKKINREVIKKAKKDLLEKSKEKSRHLVGDHSQVESRGQV